jgi:glycerol-3-phosphate acyltransferase PlsY
VLTTIALLLFSYLIGSIPAGYIVGRFAGIDIRRVGSGNIGATNVVRVLGKKYGYPVFAFDFLKGFLAVAISLAVYDRAPAILNRDLCGILSGICSVLGHSFPVWLQFKGGKGVATSAGVIVALMPLAALIVGIVWVATFAISRYVSLASILAAVAMPIAAAFLLWAGQIRTLALVYFALVLAVLVVVRHRTNLSRLFQGTEPRFQRR